MLKFEHVDFNLGQCWKRKVIMLKYTQNKIKKFNGLNLQINSEQ